MSGPLLSAIVKLNEFDLARWCLKGTYLYMFSEELTQKVLLDIRPRAKLHDAHYVQYSFIPSPDPLVAGGNIIYGR